MMTDPQPTLILFDIDGTLLRSNNCGRVAVENALDDLFGFKEPTHHVEYAGKNDWQILLDILGPLGYEPDAVAALMPRFTETVAAHLARIIAAHDVHPLPGALELVRDLVADPMAYVGLVTGNSARTAPIKLQAAGFDLAWFGVGAYGDESPIRDHLPPLAVERALARWEISFAPERVVIVGDTVHDVVSARAIGARAVAVLTGPRDHAKIAAVRPYATFDDLSDHLLVKAALFGEACYGG